MCIRDSAGVERLLAKERALGDAITFADIIPEVAGVYPRVMLEGELDAGAWSCGMVAGLIHDIPTVRELIERTMSEAEALIRGRLMGLLLSLIHICMSSFSPIIFCVVTLLR